MSNFWWWQWFTLLPRWPDSIRQPRGNPLQADRLPDASGAELQYPTYRHTPAEDRRHVRLLLLGYAATSLFIAGYGYLYQRTIFSSTLVGLVATFALYLFALNDLGREKPRWRWALYVGLGPLVVVALFTFIEPWAYLLLATVAAVRLSDLFATHYFHLKTCAPLPRSRAMTLRGHWARRARPSRTPAKGLELYGLAALAIGGILLAVFVLEKDRPTEYWFDLARSHPLVYNFITSSGYVVHLPMLLAGLAALVAFPWASERLLAYLFDRRPVGFRTMLRAFGEAVVAWFAYNRHGASAPGLFQSPSGSYTQRRRMTWATVALFACFLVQLSDRERQTWERFRADGLWGIPLGAASPPGGTIRLVSYQPEAEGPAAGGGAVPALQPWQEAYLRRLRPEQRQAYLDRLRRARESGAEPSATTSAAAPPAAGRSAWGVYTSRLVNLVKVLLKYGLIPLAFAVVPPLYVLGCCFATSARVAGLWGQEFRTESGARLLNTETWDDLVGRIRASGDTIERDSLLLGVNAWDDTPVIVPRSVFAEHAHLLGDSGSGKTSLGIASLVTQFIRFGDCSVVIIDLKGDDLALFEGARIEAGRAGLPFRWFTNELERPTYVFNPLTQSHLGRLSTYQRTDVLTAALGLQYGSDYGRGYFSDANAEMLHQALKARPEGIHSFRELARVLTEKEPFRKVSRELKLAGSHLQAIINRLADCEALNASSREAYAKGPLGSAIDMPAVFRTPQVVYFHLSSAIGMASTAEMARLALYALLSAAKTTEGERKQVFLVIDEFQRIVANNLELFLQQARSMNIGVVLANQTLGDLKAAGVDLIPTIRANTRFRQIFAASDLAEQEEIVRTSGETTVYSRSFSRYLGSTLGAAGTSSLSETVTPRLRLNDVLLATDHPQQSIVSIRRGQGYAQFGGLPFVMTSSHHITQEEYERRKRAPWPDRPGETITPSLRPAAEGGADGGDGPAPPDPVLPPPPSTTPAGPTPSADRDADDADDPFAALRRAQEARKQQATRRQAGPNPKPKARSPKTQKGKGESP